MKFIRAEWWSVQLVAGPDPNSCLLRRLQIGVDCLESRLTNLINAILLMEADRDHLLEKGSRIKDAIYDLGVMIDQMNNQASLPSLSDNKGIRLRKISVPFFDDNIMNWNIFWQQFEISVHNETELKYVEKLAYLREALKNGPARHIFEGVMKDAEYYKEAIGCLRTCYN